MPSDPVLEDVGDTPGKAAAESSAGTVAVVLPLQDAAAAAAEGGLGLSEGDAAGGPEQDLPEEHRAGQSCRDAEPEDAAAPEGPSPPSASDGVRPETDAQTVRTLSLEVEDQELLRGVALHGLLRGFGRHCRTQALASECFTEAEAAWLFGHSRRVACLHEFLSHSWRDNYLKKFLCLCLYYNSFPAALGCLAVALALFAVQTARLVPGWVYSSWETQAGTEEVYGAYLCTMIMALLYPLALVSWHHLPACLGGGRARAVFLDKLCVHQTDLSRKEAGIRSFAAMIAKSDRLLVLWSPEYFGRLWCTLEMAAFVYIQQSNRLDWHTKLPGRLAFRPLQLATVTFGVVLSFEAFTVIGVLVYAVTGVLGWPTSTSLVLVQLCAVLGGAPLGQHLLRAYVRDRDVLASQLENVSVESASCFSDADREVVYATIEEWFGSIEKFNDHVRHRVSEFAQSNLPSNTHFPLRLSMSIWPANIFFYLDCVAVRMQLQDKSFVVAYGLAFVQSLVALELWISLSMRVACLGCVKRRRRSATHDACVSVAGAWLALLPPYICGAVAVQLVKRGPFAVLAWGAVTATVTAVARSPAKLTCPPRRQRGLPGPEPAEAPQ